MKVVSVCPVLTEDVKGALGDFFLDFRPGFVACCFDSFGGFAKASVDPFAYNVLYLFVW